jgi:hypothetical protein
MSASKTEPRIPRRKTQCRFVTTLFRPSVPPRCHHSLPTIRGGPDRSHRHARISNLTGVNAKEPVQVYDPIYFRYLSSHSRLGQFAARDAEEHHLTHS